MIASSRPGRFYSSALLLILSVLVLLPVVALASTPVINGRNTEIIGPRLYRTTNTSGQVQTMPDLAISGQLLVQMWPTAGPAELQAALANTNCTLVKSLKSPGLFLVALPDGTTVPAGQRSWKMLPGVKLASPNRVLYWSRVPNDPMYPQQWHLPKIDADQAWDVQTGSAGVIIAILDSGVDLSHPDLSSRIWQNAGEVGGNGLDDDGNGYIDDVQGWDFQFSDNDPNPDTAGYWGYANHGTHVAGLAAAASNNGIGVAGHDWNARIMALKVGNGDTVAPTDAIIEAINYAVAHGADVINLSLGGGYDEIWTDPITLAWAAGTVVVAAAGNSSWTFNDSQDSWDSPVCNDGPNFLDNHVLGVGATDEDDEAAYFSNLDESAREFVDVMAPGVDVLSTVAFDFGMTPHQYAEMSGTSMACPVTTGLAALVRAHYPGNSAASVIAQIRAGCENIDLFNPDTIGKMGMGRINSARSLIDMPPGPPRSVMAADTAGDIGGSITVTWNTSLDDGRGFNDVTRYEVRRSNAADGTFDVLASLPKGSKSYADASVSNYTDYYYVVVAFDAANSTTSSVAGPAQARDDLAPEAVALTATDTQGDLGSSISLSWSGYAPPADFREYRIYRAESAFTDVREMTPLKTITSAATRTYQDKTTVDNTDYWYAVTCVDTSLPANELKDVTAVGPVRSNPNYAFGFAPGLSMISLGLTVPDNNLDAIFDLSGGAQLARWNPQAGTEGAYSTYAAGSTDPFLMQAPGRGFWLRNALPTVLNLSGAAPTGTVRVDFVPGWNQLGNPYIEDVDVAPTQVRIGGTTYTLEQSNESGWTRNYMWGWNNATNSYKLISATLPFSTATVARGEGFFFLATRPGQLVLQNPSLAVPASAQVAEAKPLAVDWSLQISAATEGVADTDNFMGVCAEPEKANGILSPPPARDGFDFSFKHNGVRTATSFVRSVGEGQSFKAELACARPRAQVKLNWPDLSALPRDCRPVLKDLATGKSVYMRTSSAYSFTLNVGETRRQFEISVDSKAGELLAIRTLQTGSGASGARIFYSLSAPASVDIDVLNLAGRLVRRLQSGTLSSGACTASWDGSGANGAKAPAGSYLVRLTARTEDGQAVSAVQSLYLRR